MLKPSRVDQTIDRLSNRFKDLVFTIPRIDDLDPAGLLLRQG